MDHELNEEITLLDVTRRTNRALRSVNRHLRRRQERLQAEHDETIAALFDAPSEAELAFGELWGNALFDCGPQDYDYMVDEIIKKFRLVEAQESAKVQGTEPSN